MASATRGAALQQRVSSRAARVCRRWHEAASQPALWHTVTLSPPLAGRSIKGGAKAEKKLLASLEWLMPNRWGIPFPSPPFCTRVVWEAPGPFLFPCTKVMGGEAAWEHLQLSLCCLPRFSQLQRLTLIHWKSQVHPVLKVSAGGCPARQL